MKIFIATDHAGFDLKEELVAFLREEGHDVVDVGAHEYDKNDDYPLFISKAALGVVREVGSVGIVLGASGQGEAMMANRIKGVRAAVYYGEPRGVQTDIAGKNLSIITGSREHNNANVLSIGARFVSVDEAKTAIAIWLTTAFSKEKRHVRRIALLDTLTT